MLPYLGSLCGCWRICAPPRPTPWTSYNLLDVLPCRFAGRAAGRTACPAPAPAAAASRRQRRCASVVAAAAATLEKPAAGEPAVRPDIRNVAIIAHVDHGAAAAA